MSKAEDLLKEIEALDEERKKVLAPIQVKVQDLVSCMGGWRTENFELKQSVAQALQQLLLKLDLGLCCPREGCSVPSNFTCQQAGGVKEGHFQFYHRVNGRRTTHYSSKEFPRGVQTGLPPEDLRRSSLKN